MKIMPFLKQSASNNQQVILYLLACVSLILLGVIYLFTVKPIFFPLDDPYITLHNAQVLHWGYDPSYPGISPLFGTTSAIHLVEIFLLLYWLPPEIALLTTQWVAIIAYAVGLLRLAFLNQASVLNALLFLFIGLAAAYTPYQLLNGLETGLAMAAMTWLLCMASAPEQSKTRNYGLPLLGGIFSFIRPELLIMVALLTVWQSRGQWRRLLKLGLLVLLGALPFLLWYGFSTGYPLPETIMAKVAFYAQVNLPFLIRFKLMLFNTVFFGIIFGSYLGFFGVMVLLLASPLGRIGALYIAIFLIFATTYLPLILSPNFNVGRYWYPCIPILLFGMLPCLRHSDRILRWGANFLLIGLVCQTLFYLPSHWKFYLTERKNNFTKCHEMAAWCLGNLPTKSVLLIHDAGYLAFATPFRLVDMVGLKTPSSIHYHQIITLPSSGTKRVTAISSIISDQQPDYLILLPEWDRKIQITRRLRQLGWHLTLLNTINTLQGYTILRISSKNMPMISPEKKYNQHNNKNQG